MASTAASIFLACCVLVLASAKFSCRNDKDEEVPWFTGYKMPELGDAVDPAVKKGVAFAVLDPQRPQWSMMNATIDQERDHHVYHTVRQFYEDDRHMPKDHFLLMYNDEKPDGNVSFTRGHAKGLVLFDQDQGFWLIHSVPKFPPSDRYVYPHSGHRYGQSFMCITFPSSELQSIAKQLLFIEPYIYAGKLAGKLRAKYPDLHHVLHEYRMVSQPPFSRTTTLTSTDGAEYTHFAKSHRFGKDLYANLVAPALSVPLSVESWRNGGGDLPPYCQGPEPVRDIMSLSFKPVGVKFDNRNDHAKWAVASTEQDEPWTCIGDINRQIHQLKRGGGTMCRKDRPIYQQYQDAVVSTDRCSKLRRSHG